jgi:hypothetical protein
MHLAAGDEGIIGSASDVFEIGIIAKLRISLSETALATPVFFTDRLSNRILACCISLRNGTHIIGINSRFKTDPEIIAHALVEEFVHVQQILDGVDFETQRKEHVYAERPYEQQAKQIAAEILGYDPTDAYDTILIREVPSGILA